MERDNLHNNTYKDINKTVQYLFEKQVSKNPANVALIYNNQELTYKKLNEKSNEVVRLLREKNVQPNSIVGLMCQRSFEMMIGILGILKSGAAYLPIDPNYPKDRIDYMLRDSNTNILLTQTHLKEKIYFEKEIIYLDDNTIYNSISEIIEEVNQSNDLAYVIYTSGSTGMPKGVMIEHKGLTNFVNGVKERIDFSPDKTILSVTTMSFDIFVLETLLPLTQGLTIVIASDKEQKNPKLLCELIKKNKIDMLQMTPSRMQLLITYQEDLECLKNISEIMIGGETFPKLLLEKIKASTSARIYNMYGPTETTIWSSIKDLTESNEITIGTPILNTEFHIVNNENKLLSIGDEGELCISGDGLARGYLNRTDLTKEKFIPNPVSPGEFMYKTGDLSKKMPNGDFECIGRIDNQIKLRGFRIELDEIQYHLTNIEDVKEAIVIARENKEGKYLCAYIISDKLINDVYIKEQLSKILPDYMIPPVFLQIDKFPLTPNGKIDKNAFLESDYCLDENLKKDFHDNSIENQIRQILVENITTGVSIEKIALNDEFSKYGVDSLAYMKILLAIEGIFEIEFDDEYLDIGKIKYFKDLLNYVEGKL